MNTPEFDKLAVMFKALGHPTRIHIVYGLIQYNECNVSKMVENLNLSQPNISQHLSILKNAGVIEGYRKGNQICYKVVSEEVRNIVKVLSLESCKLEQ